nr:hypothetical protein BaRGS_016031 [Batillaria attramentaria]
MSGNQDGGGNNTASRQMFMSYMYSSAESFFNNDAQDVFQQFLSNSYHFDHHTSSSHGLAANGHHHAPGHGLVHGHGHAHEHGHHHPHAPHLFDCNGGLFGHMPQFDLSWDFDRLTRLNNNYFDFAAHPFDSIVGMQGSKD